MMQMMCVINPFGLPKLIDVLREKKGTERGTECSSCVMMQCKYDKNAILKRLKYTEKLNR